MGNSAVGKSVNALFSDVEPGIHAGAQSGQRGFLGWITGGGTPGPTGITGITGMVAVT